VSFNASLLVMMGIFWAVYWILRISFFTPVMNLLEKRQATISDAQGTYDSAVATTDDKLEEEHVRLTEARTQAMASRDQERREAQAKRQEQLDTAKAEIQERLSIAAKELENQVGIEKQSLEQQADQIAGTMVERLLGRTA
jgi:F0F1-type ATP synthase membrane subunit b/b'